MSAETISALITLIPVLAGALVLLSKEARRWASMYHKPARR
jgi:hypothetical protein